jgi:hypothetical protein
MAMEKRFPGLHGEKKIKYREFLDTRKMPGLPFFLATYTFH